MPYTITWSVPQPGFGFVSDERKTIGITGITVTPYFLPNCECRRNRGCGAPLVIPGGAQHIP